MSHTCLTALQRRQLNSPLKSPGSVQFEFLQFEFALVQVRSVRQTGLFGLLWFVLWQWRIQDFCKGGAAAGAFGMPQAPSCPLSLRPLRKFRGS